MKSQAEQVEEIRIRTEAWINGWSTSPDAPFQIEAVADLYDHSRSLLSYDFVGSAEGLTGWDNCAREYQRFMDALEDWSLARTGEIRVEVLGEMAWSACSLRGKGQFHHGPTIEFDGRATLIWRLRDTGWKIQHEHGSVPLPGG